MLFLGFLALLKIGRQMRDLEAFVTPLGRGGVNANKRIEIVGVRGSPERDISSLGAMGQGPGGTCPELCACRHVRLSADSLNTRYFMKAFVYF